MMSAVAESEMASGADLRRMALALAGTSEAPHFERAAFKVTRIYVTLAADGRTANFKFSPDEQEFKCMMAPAAFAPVPGGLGRAGMDHRDAVGDERGAVKGRTGDGVASRRTEEEIATVTDCTCWRGGAPGSLDGTR